MTLGVDNRSMTLISLMAAALSGALMCLIACTLAWSAVCR
jgi:hypothetical protein